MRRSLSAVALAAFLTGCLPASCTRPVINTVALPQDAIQERPIPYRRGKSNRALGIYANECAAALDEREKDIKAIVKAVAP